MLDQMRSHPDADRILDGLNAAEDAIRRGNLEEADTLLEASRRRLSTAQTAAEEGAFSSPFGGAAEGGLTEAPTRQSARVGLAETHHIATRFRAQNRALLDSVGLDIDNELNLIREFEEHGQLRGWYDWDNGVYRYHMRGHHPEYHRWVTGHLRQVAPSGLPPDQALRRIAGALQRLDRIIRQHPDVLAYGPRILPPNLQTLTP
jgi:hypothetical protein